jgi:hypothetical protein
MTAHERATENRLCHLFVTCPHSAWDVRKTAGQPSTQLPIKHLTKLIKSFFWHKFRHLLRG